MRVPVSWLAEYVALPPGLTARELAAALVRAGLEVEAVEEVGADVTGPLVVGRVLSAEPETASNGKTVRWCSVDVGEAEPRGIVCGAPSLDPGDTVVVALPGAVLPGGFAIAARRTYGHTSDGMICSARELGIGEDHSGVVRLGAADIAAGAVPGAPALAVLGLPDAVLDIAVTPDRGYCLSVRGVAREAATALGVAFTDPAAAPAAAAPAADGAGWPVRVQDAGGCDRFVTRQVDGLDPAAASPAWLATRLTLAGMRPRTAAVDVTNYVMLELGQPLHGYDADALAGAIVVRGATDGEQLVTLDGSTRRLDGDDLVIADDSGAIGVAGVMGGQTTELSEATTRVVIEAAHFAPTRVARAARRHKLPSEAARRFERGVDGALAPAAAQRAVDLLVRFAGGTPAAGVSDVDTRTAAVAITLPLGRPEQVVGRPYTGQEVRDHLLGVGCRVVDEGADALAVTPPSWRPDLATPVDLVEEVARLAGYDTIPSHLPAVPPGAGYTVRQRHGTLVSRALAGAGLVEVLSYPFVAPATLDAFGLAVDDQRRAAVRVANPLSEEEPLLRTTLLPGLLAALRRNVGRGFPDLALFEVGRVFLPRPGAPAAPRPPVDRRPRADELTALDAALPEQPTAVAAVWSGLVERAGWWGPGRVAQWSDAVQAARVAAGAIDAPVHVEAADLPPWHPGRCARIVLDGPDGPVAGYAGELHPRVLAALELPPRTCAMELNMSLLARYAEPLDSAPAISGFPVAVQDVALVVADDVPADEVAAAVAAGAGSQLESVALLDVYTGPQVPDGHRSLAYRLRLRAADHTLTPEETAAARDGAVAEAGRRVGAVQRA